MERQSPPPYTLELTVILIYSKKEFAATRSSFAKAIRGDVGEDWGGTQGVPRSLLLYGIVNFTYQVCIEFLHTVGEQNLTCPCFLGT